MEPKLKFIWAPATILATIAATYGATVAISDANLKGRYRDDQIQEIIRPTPTSVLTSLQNQISTFACPVIDAEYGVQSCDASQIDYHITYKRHRGRSWFVRTFKDFDRVVQRDETPPAVANWINTRIENRYCERINAWYGVGLCDSETINYTLQFLRTSGQSRTIVDIPAPVFCTKPPPNAPVSDGAP